MKIPGKIIVWPRNLDSSKSRKHGRNIPKGQGIGQPKLAELEAAAHTLGLEAESVPEKSPPSNWWEKTGYLIVARHGKPRGPILRDLAKEVLKARHEEKPTEKPRQATPHR